MFYILYILVHIFSLKIKLYIIVYCKQIYLYFLNVLYLDFDVYKIIYLHSYDCCTEFTRSFLHYWFRTCNCKLVLSLPFIIEKQCKPENKIQPSTRFKYTEFQVVITVLSFVGNPVYCKCIVCKLSCQRYYNLCVNKMQLRYLAEILLNLVFTISESIIYNLMLNIDLILLYKSVNYCIFTKLLSIQLYFCLFLFIPKKTGNYSRISIFNQKI